jgi:phosphonoacetaldehyde hydrolase
MEFMFRRLYRGRLKAIILDWAGTAVDFGSFAPTAVFLRLFDSQGVTITADDARSGMGLMKKDHLRTILARPKVAEAWESVHSAPASESDIDALFENFVPLQRAVLKDYAVPIPGLLDVIKVVRKRGMKIGSTTGYLRSMMDILAPEAAKHGYTPDCIVCPDEVPAGRPYPWMCYQNAIRLGVYPMPAMVKVGDTLPDIAEGLNSGMWTVGLSLTGNLVGLSEADVDALSPKKVESARETAASQLYQAGAHYVLDTIRDLPVALNDIELRLRRGEQP